MTSPFADQPPRKPTLWTPDPDLAQALECGVIAPDLEENRPRGREGGSASTAELEISKRGCRLRIVGFLLLEQEVRVMDQVRRALLAGGWTP